MYESEEDYYEPVRTISAFNNKKMIKEYLKDITNDHKSQGKWKIQLTMEINFISSKDSNETRTMHTTSDKIEILIGKQIRQIRLVKIFLNLLKINEKK